MTDSQGAFTHAPPRKKQLIVIDAGHGGKDPGSCSERLRYEEKELTLMTARFLAEHLERLGYRTLLTRKDDTFIPLNARAECANTSECSLFVSVHFNHASDHRADGIEVFYYKDAKGERQARSKLLGEEVLSRVVQQTGAESRGIKPGNYAVIRETTMPAILIEGGFLSNPQEREKLRDPQYLKFLAWGVAKGIDHYVEISERHAPQAAEPKSVAPPQSGSSKLGRQSQHGAPR